MDEQFFYYPGSHRAMKLSLCESNESKLVLDIVRSSKIEFFLRRTLTVRLCLIVRLY